MAQKAEAPTFDIYAVIDPDADAPEDAKSEWIKIGPLWKTKNADILSGHINVLPLEAFSARRLHIVVQRRTDKSEAEGEQARTTSSGNRNQRRR